MDLQHLRTFVAIVHQGSFAAAARQLGVAPSVVTRAVAALEHDLGVRLMTRSSRKLALTERGALYHEQVEGVLLALDRASEEARDSTGGVQGSVRLTSSVAYGQAVIVPLLPALHAQHPALEVDLLLTDRVVDLAGERVDVAVRLGARVDPALVGLQIASVRYRVVASPGYLARHGRPRVPADLAACDCLRFALPGFRSQWRFRLQGGAVEAVGVRGWLLMSTALALHRAALDGLGPALLPDWLVRPALESAELIDLFPAHEVSAGSFDSAVWLLFSSRAYMPRRVRAVVDFLKAQLGPAAAAPAA